MSTSEIKMVPYVTYTSERLREFQDQFNGTGIFYDTLSEIENDVKSDINDNDFIIRMFLNGTFEIVAISDKRIEDAIAHIDNIIDEMTEGYYE
ncbi:hypothetical protein VPA32_orf280 [Klebsiella phage vB_KpnM_VPA32]|uniref:Uncharacterized protein n=2 Tax=Karamvirus TaxID=1913650 RepID=E5DHZ5_9CAUD|nr:hypothetical protein CC31p263 [Enterobacter phage CC31]ADB81759.1 hypothetical protein CC31p263 [Enterobacter phage CC31]MCO0615374.1 hypothetical protein [Lutimaribacter sp. EGI FJ00015]URQ04063.1 hypothetical protein vBEclMUFV01_095 [Enterobacter phage vB_EclM-UFV01]WJJ59245.1 hypothetical protein VPA32_orf280 [Klebsiella phage vB_KpnM_VPA32]